jgi:hypothetical protein
MLNECAVNISNGAANPVKAFQGMTSARYRSEGSHERFSALAPSCPKPIRLHSPDWNAAHRFPCLIEAGLPVKQMEIKVTRVE